jgi:F0F1-type ATP synthase membrane subunit b/b'
MAKPLSGVQAQGEQEAARQLEAERAQILEVQKRAEEEVRARAEELERQKAQMELWYRQRSVKTLVLVVVSVVPVSPAQRDS